MPLAAPVLAPEIIRHRRVRARRVARSPSRDFGHRIVHEPAPVSSPARSLITPELKLFATTFVAGFLFVSVLIA